MQPSVTLFFALATQWRTLSAAPGHVMRTGIDYGVMLSVAGMLKIDADARVFNDVRAMEAAAIETWSSKR